MAQATLGLGCENLGPPPLPLALLVHPRMVEVGGILLLQPGLSIRKLLRLLIILLRVTLSLQLLLLLMLLLLLLKQQLLGL
jgi:hypothetical protein